MTAPNETHGKAVRLARAALDAALASKWQAMGRYVQRISDELGEDGLTTALMAWCDTLWAHSTDGDMQPRQIGGLGFANYQTGEMSDPSGVPVEVGWAGRLLQARAEMDEGKFVSLLHDLPDDPTAIGAHFSALLNIVSATINGLPRGYALMGKATT